jgi:ribosome recycling factor
LAKQVKGMGEEAKVAVRNIRRDAMDEIKKAKKDSTMTEDEATASEKTIQDVTDKFIKQVDVLTAAKEKELMAI